MTRFACRNHDRFDKHVRIIETYRVSSFLFSDEDADDVTHRLHDIRAEEVSIVDRAANRRRFLLLKRSEEMSDNQGAQLVEGEHGDLTARKDTDTDTEKQEFSIPGPVKEAVMRAGQEALNRLMSFVNQVKEAGTTDEQSKTPLPAKLGSELKAIIGMLSSLSEKYPYPTAKGETEETEKSDEPEDASKKILAAIDDLKKLLPKEPTKKDTEAVAAQPDLAPVAKAFEKLADAVSDQAKQIAEIRKSHSGSTAVVVEGESGKDAFHWPYDLAQAVRDEAK